MAKNNSYNNGIEGVHKILIKWICYFTGISFKICLIGLYVIVAITILWAMLFFIDSTKNYLEIRAIMNH